MARRRRSAHLWFPVVLALVAVACQAETTTIGSAGGATATSAPVPDDSSATPGADANDDGGADPTVPPVAVLPSPTATAEPPPPPFAPVTLDWFLGFDPSGTYGYETIGNPWEQARDCDDSPREAVIGIDLAASNAEDLVGFVAGVQVVGGAERLVFAPDGSGVLLSSCGEYPDEVPTLSPVRLGDRGRLVPDGPAIELVKQADDQGLWMTGVEDGAALIEVTVGTTAPGAEWTRELRRVDLQTGAVEVVAVISLEDEAARLSRPAVTSPDGRFTYREIADPAGRLGCEGFGLAATIGIDRGAGVEPVWGSDQPAYSNIVDLHFGPADLVAWTSSCEGFGSIHVGRLTDDGTIVDQHYLETYEELPEGFVEYRHFRLTGDGRVVALGQRFDADYQNPVPAFRRIDLADDPGFVTTGPNPPWIDTANPLVETLAGTGEWYVGDDPVDTGGCGRRTLYASTTAGFVRGLSTFDPVDAVVDVVVSAPRTLDYGGGISVRTRAFVALTECPEEYSGRRVWFGDENEVPSLGLYLVPAALPEVADVLSVREEPRDGDPYFVDTFAEVVYRDGSIEEVVLLPAGSG